MVYLVKQCLFKDVFERNVIRDKLGSIEKLKSRVASAGIFSTSDESKQRTDERLYMSKRLLIL